MNDSDFDDFLHSARADVPLPGSFKQGVWHRIQCEDLDSSPRVIGFQAFAVTLVRPWGAVAGIAATMALGLWLGIATVPEPKDGKVAYAKSISPFAQTEHK